MSRADSSSVSGFLSSALLRHPASHRLHPQKTANPDTNIKALLRRFIRSALSFLLLIIARLPLFYFPIIDFLITYFCIRTLRFHALPNPAKNPIWIYYNIEKHRTSTQKCLYFTGFITLFEISCFLRSPLSFLTKRLKLHSMILLPP